MKIVNISEIPAETVVSPTDLMDIYKVCREMTGLCDRLRGVGLAAVQVGIPWNLFVVKLDGSLDSQDKDKFGYFLDCSYHPVALDKVQSIEGCLSILNEDDSIKTFLVERFKNVLIKGKRLYDSRGLELKDVEFEATHKQQGIVFQHEIDHTKNVLISDHGQEYLIW